MVVDRGISLSLHSPESLNTLTPHALEEYLLPSGNIDDDPPNTTIRYVPVLPGSSFWLSYRILVLPPPGLDTKLYVFKLFFGFTHLVTWSVDGDAAKSEQQWKGRCMFGLFADPTIIDNTNGGRRAFQKRAFAFAPPLPTGPRSPKGLKKVGDQERGEGSESGTRRKKLQKKRKSVEFVHPFTPPRGKTKATHQYDERFIDVKVFRARSKKRIPRDVPHFDEGSLDTKIGKDLDLKHAGYATRPHPRRYYQFDLIDPIDEPYTTFRFYYRSMDELKEMGIAGGTSESSADSQATITPDTKDQRKTSSQQPNQRLTEAKSTKQDQARPEYTNEMVTPELESQSDTVEGPQESSAPKVKRLSMPPSIKLLPSLGSWKKTRSPDKGQSEYDPVLRAETSLALRSKSSAENMRKRSSQGLWRAFHEEREAEHGGY